MSTQEKIADYIVRGAVQLSRKYRTIGVPPVLTEGQTYRKMCAEKWPSFVGCPALVGSEALAAQTLATYDVTCHIELSHEEFNEWLVQKGRKPRADPPKPFASWREFHIANGTHWTQK